MESYSKSSLNNEHFGKRSIKYIELWHRQVNLVLSCLRVCLIQKNFICIISFPEFVVFSHLCLLFSCMMHLMHFALKFLVIRFRASSYFR